MDEKRLRTIDESVATKVMGWQGLPQYNHPLWKCPDTGGYANNPPRFSRNFGAAITILEKLSSFGNITWDIGYTTKNTYYCEISAWNEEKTDTLCFFEKASSAPLAISLAALRACGVEVEKW